MSQHAPSAQVPRSMVEGCWVTMSDRLHKMLFLLILIFFKNSFLLISLFSPFPFPPHNSRQILVTQIVYLPRKKKKSSSSERDC